MLAIALIRAGRTDFDQQGRIQGTLDLPLCDLGREEIEQLAGQIAHGTLDAVYAARSLSAWETAVLLAGRCGVRAKPLNKLTNANLGLWQGMCLDDVRLKHPKVFRQLQEEPETVCPPQGEMLSAVQRRAADAVRWLRRKHRRGAVALVAPAPLAAVLHGEISGQPVRDLWSMSAGIGAYEWFELAGPRLSASKPA